VVVLAINIGQELATLTSTAYNSYQVKVKKDYERTVLKDTIVELNLNSCEHLEGSVHLLRRGLHTS
jgi:hypothetical protein